MASEKQKIHRAERNDHSPREEGELSSSAPVREPRQKEEVPPLVKAAGILLYMY